MFTSKSMHFVIYFTTQFYVMELILGETSNQENEKSLENCKKNNIEEPNT